MQTTKRSFTAVVGGLLLVGCASSSMEDSHAPRAAASSAKAQFECADRNKNEYIDKTELVYLRVCGISEDLKCLGLPDDADERPADGDYELGLRMLQVTDTDGDERISKLEFRAHCSRAKRAS